MKGDCGGGRDGAKAMAEVATKAMAVEMAGAVTEAEKATEVAMAAATTAVAMAMAIAVAMAAAAMAR